MAYGEHRRQIQMALPKPSKLFTPGVITILALMIVGYAVTGYFSEWALGDLCSVPPSPGHLILVPGAVARGHLWQLFTYSFIDPCGSNLVWHGLLLLLCGSAIEREWRTRSFLMLWFIVTVTCAVLWVLVSLILSTVIGREFWGLGSHSGAYGILGAFGLLFRKQRILVFFWGMEAQYLCLLLIGIGLVIGIRQPISWIWVAGAGVAYLYVKLRTKSRLGGARKKAEKVNRFFDID